MYKLDFQKILQHKTGTNFVEKLFKKYLKDKNTLFERWYRETGEFGEIYPSQGLLRTPYDFLESVGKTLMPEDEFLETLKVRRYFLEILNHPSRLDSLEEIQRKKYIAPDLVDSSVMDYSVDSGLAMSIGDLGAKVVGSEDKRISRRQILSQGPYVKLGKRGRIPFASGAMPDVFGAPAALATVAMCHALAGVPRNGAFSEVERQVDLVRKVFSWMKNEPMLVDRKDSKRLLKIWRRNVMGVVEPEIDNGMRRTEKLFEVGTRAFRVYSPEPGKDAELMVKQIRKEYGSKVEIFVGQITSIEQARRLEEAGADGLYTGIGGGGRCITAVRSGSVVDWPNLLWKLRGEIGIPVLVEGGASDHVGTTLLLGASGIGVSRIAAGGTIESPGGLLYMVNSKGKWFKPYGGEASARTKYQDGKMLGMGVPAFVEGETTQSWKSYIPYVKPTVAANMYFLIEDLILSLVFRGVDNIGELQKINPSPLRRVTAWGETQQNTH